MSMGIRIWEACEKEREKVRGSERKTSQKREIRRKYWGGVRAPTWAVLMSPCLFCVISVRVRQRGNERERETKRERERERRTRSEPDRGSQWVRERKSKKGERFRKGAKGST